MPTKNELRLTDLHSYSAGDLKIKIMEGSDRPDGLGYPKTDSKVWDVVTEIDTKHPEHQEAGLRADLLLDVIRGKLAARGYEFKEGYRVDYFANERTLPVSKTKRDGSPADLKDIASIVEHAIDGFEWIVYPNAAKARQQAEIKAAQAAIR